MKEHEKEMSREKRERMKRRDRDRALSSNQARPLSGEKIAYGFAIHAQGTNGPC